MEWGKRVNCIRLAQHWTRWRNTAPEAWDDVSCVDTRVDSVNAITSAQLSHVNTTVPSETSSQ